MLQQKQLVYVDHSEEIASINSTLADIQRCTPFPPALSGTVERLLLRLDALMTVQGAALKDFP